jgi:hypothetical protein
MAKNWVLILFTVLMVVQSLSIAADVSPIHSDHEPQELVDISADDSSNQAADLSPDSDHKTPPSHCHSCHCHGSHMLLSMQLPILPTASASQVTLADTVNHLSPTIPAIHRPPIA